MLLKALERLFLYLPNTLSGHAENAADLFKRPRLAAVQAIAKLDDLTGFGRQRIENALKSNRAQRHRRSFERRESLVVWNPVGECRRIVDADRCVESNREPIHVEKLAHLFGRKADVFRDLLRCCFASAHLQEVALRSHDAIELKDSVERDSDRPRLICRRLK